ncbi:MAG: acyl-CoA thioesterase II, partial [Acidimicrobiia bacterium]|nr:acyl-CoA thioesterase II [Acidimicrobiia bacterium]
MEQQEMLERLLASLRLREADDGVLRGPRVHEAPGHPVFGGELLGQAIMAAALRVPG